MTSFETEKKEITFSQDVKEASSQDDKETNYNEKSQDASSQDQEAVSTKQEKPKDVRIDDKHSKKLEKKQKKQDEKQKKQDAKDAKKEEKVAKKEAMIAQKEEIALKKKEIQDIKKRAKQADKEESKSKKRAKKEEKSGSGNNHFSGQDDSLPEPNVKNNNEDTAEGSKVSNNAKNNKSPKEPQPSPYPEKKPQETVHKGGRFKRFIRSFWTAIALDLVFNLAYIIYFNIVSAKNDVVHSCPVVVIIMNTFLICMKILERYPFPERVWIFHKTQLAQVLISIQYLLLFIITGMIIGKLVFLIGGTIHDPLNIGFSKAKDLNLSLATRIALIAVAGVSCFADLFVLIHLWTLPQKGGGSQMLLAVTCFFNFILGIVEIKLYHDSMIRHDDIHIRVLPVLYVYTAAFVICGSMIGLFLSFTITKSNRLSDIIGKLTIFMDCYFAIVALLCLISCANSIVLRGGDDSGYNIVVAIPTIYGCCIALCIMIIICSRYLRSRLPPNLAVEELKLKKLTEAQKSAYAKMITFNAKSNPGVSGEAVISLMEAYSETRLEGMSCKVLRVYRPDIEKSPENDNVKNILGKFPSKVKKDLESGPEEHANKGSKRKISMGSSIHEKNETYEASKTWDVLDLQKTVFDEEDNPFEMEPIEAPKPLSKNQRKKLAKKAAAAMNGATDEFPLELPTEKDIRERAKFHEDLMATEALVLLTSIDCYDLTASLTGKFGKFMSDWFGKNSRSQLLCIRFGLLAFHWPFVRSTFYCSNSKRPVARSASVMFAISNWNKNQPKNSRCTILLDPTYKNAVPEQAIRFGGWYKVRLPASHIIDLRPFKGKSLQEYFKAIKYRNQDGPFKQAGGVAVEEKEFSEENCHSVMSLWKNIAESRTSNGNTSVLVNPDEEFMQVIGTKANESSHRSLLFLKVDDEVISSCILFRLGDTITSDLQGLHQEKARPMKAYFVMMQEVIKIALKEGKSFVDFGPTTEKPKVDIGCQVVPLTGALRTSNVMLSAAVKVAASSVKV